MKRYFALLITVLVIGLPAKAQEPLTPEVNRMIEYLMLADEAGLNVPLYIMELSDQLAMLSLTDYMDKEIMEQGAAAAELYAHPLVCMNYAACLMKQRKYGSSLHYLNKAWKQDNKNVMLATNMARCHFELGDDANCQAFLNKALSIDPDYGLALQLKATLLLKKGDQESQLQAVEYMLRSALDVWNGISVRQFNSLIAQMQQLYYYYNENRMQIPDNFKKLPTPLDGMEKYFQPVMRAGRVSTEEPEADKFPYPVFVGTLEYEYEGQDCLSQAALGGLSCDFMKKSQEVKIPFESSEYPVEYSGLIGGDNYQPDSRVFHMTLLAYYYHQIKLLEASLKASLKEMRETEPYEKRKKEAQDVLFEKMEEQIDKGVVTPGLLKAYGEELYLAGKEYVNATVRSHLNNWEKLMRPALEAYSRDIKTGLAYIGNDTAFKYIQSRFDKDIATIYDYNELSYLATLQGEVNMEHMLSSLAEEILEEMRRQDQQYRDALARSRNRRYLEWEANEKLRAAGMLGLNRQKDPVPSIGIKIGGISVQVGIDRHNRVHFRLDTPETTTYKVYNTETGASATTELREVKTVGSYVNDAATTIAQDITSRGHMSFTPELGERSGEQVITDGRGNIIESSNIREQSVSISLSASANPPGLTGFAANNLSAGITFSLRKTTVKANRFGASVVPFSPRATVTFDAGVGVKGFNIFSASFGAAQGSL